MPHKDTEEEPGRWTSAEEFPLPVLIVNREGRVEHVNRMFMKAFGFEEDLRGAPTKDLLPGYPKEQMESDLARSIARPHYQTERVLVTGFRERRWVLLKFRPWPSNGASAFHMLIFTDVTHLRRHVQETAAQITKLYHLADVSSDVILSVNERGYVDHVNDAGCKLLGYHLIEVIGKPIHAILTCRRHARSERAFAIRSNGDRIPVDMMSREVPLPGKWIRIVSLRPSPALKPGGDREVDPGRVDSVDMVKKRIGQDLHDTLGQILTGMRMMGSQLLKRLEDGEKNTVAEMEDLLELMKEADEFTHMLAHGMLRSLKEGTLSEHLRAECDRMCTLFRIECRFESTLMKPIRDSLIISNAIPIVQEAISNAIRHGRAERIQVTLREADLEWLLAVEDDGVGFHHRKSSEPYSGLGMRIMRERAELIGGRFQARRTSRSTTRIECAIPKEEPCLPHPSVGRIRETGTPQPAAVN